MGGFDAGTRDAESFFFIFFFFFYDPSATGVRRKEMKGVWERRAPPRGGPLRRV